MDPVIVFEWLRNGARLPISSGDRGGRVCGDVSLVDVVELCTNGGSRSAIRHWLNGLWALTYCGNTLATRHGLLLEGKLHLYPYVAPTIWELFLQMDADYRVALKAEGINHFARAGYKYARFARAAFEEWTKPTDSRFGVSLVEAWDDVTMSVTVLNVYIHGKYLTTVRRDVPTAHSWNRCASYEVRKPPSTCRKAIKARRLRHKLA